jgi:D-alanyl-D-alanine carboxypeptidase
MAGFRRPGPLGLRNDFSSGSARRAEQVGTGYFVTPGPIGLQTSGSRARDSSGNGLAQPGSEVSFEDFRQGVLEQQIRNAQAQGRDYYPPVPPEELDIVEGQHRMRREAAMQCRNLLAAARTDLAVAKQNPKDGLAASVKSVGVGSCYRDYERDRDRWYELFDQYYHETRTQREDAAGGPHGRDAVNLLARYVSKRKAAPGFSNHSNGTAVDFMTVQGGTTYTDETSRSAWRLTWLHPWLVANAVRFRFNALSTEEWHWDYR